MTAVDDTNGTWKYSLDGGTTWTAIGAVSGSNALLLDGSDEVAFEPNPGVNTATIAKPTLTFVGWDETFDPKNRYTVDANGNNNAVGTYV
ncbi:MAG: hypothetical protein ACREHD_15280, partial [Pirellulales bacterium]